MNKELMLQLLGNAGVASSGSYSSLESYYIKQGSKRIAYQQAMDKAMSLINAVGKFSYVETCSIAGGLRRRNSFVEDIDIVVGCSNIRSAEAEFKREFSELDYSGSYCRKLSKMESIDDKLILVKFLLVPLVDYDAALMYYTGSYKFNAAIREYASRKGYHLYNFDDGVLPISYLRKPEEEVFSILGLPYHPPELRDCIENLEVDYGFSVVSSTLSLEGDLSITYNSNTFQTDMVVLKKLGVTHVGFLLDYEQYQILGSSAVEEIRNASSSSMHVKVGIKLACLSNYTEDMKTFDYVYGRYCINGNTVLNMFSLISSIKKPLIMYDFDAKLEETLRSLNTRVHWNNILKFLSENNIKISINGGKLLNNNLHPTILSNYRKLGGEFVISGFTIPSMLDKAQESALHLSKKALVGKRNCLTCSTMRILDLMGENNA